MAKRRQFSAWDEVRENIKGVKNEMIIMNVATVILGILMVIFPGAINGLICQGIGAALCVWGIIRIIKYFMSKAEDVFGSFGLVQGGAMLGFGIFFLVNPDFFVNMIDIALAIILLVMAVIKVQYAFDFVWGCKCHYDYDRLRSDIQRLVGFDFRDKNVRIREKCHQRCQ